MKLDLLIADYRLYLDIIITWLHLHLISPLPTLRMWCAGYVKSFCLDKKQNEIHKK